MMDPLDPDDPGIRGESPAEGLITLAFAYVIMSYLVWGVIKKVTNIPLEIPWWGPPVIPVVVIGSILLVLYIAFWLFCLVTE